MKKTIFGAAMAALMIATPAVAADTFVGPRVSVDAGVEDVTTLPDTNDVTYGATVGYDAKVAGPVRLGVEASVGNVFKHRDVAAGARLGVVVNDRVLLYGHAGYQNYKDVFSRKLDGLRVGAGAEVTVVGNVFAGVRYNYTDFEKGVGKHGAVVSVGLRF